MPDNVVGVTQFVSSLRQGRYDDVRVEHALHFGQGVSAYDERDIRDQLELRGLSKWFVIRSGHSRSASRIQVHKQLEKNVLIADLLTIAKHRFRARLRVEDDSELLLDHATGWHVPGMVMLEAMRQMAMASVVNSGALASLGHEYGFMIQSWNTRFMNFLLPLDAELLCVLQPAETAKSRRLEFQADVTVMQGERASAQCIIEFAALDRAALGTIEERHARSTMKQFVQAQPQESPGVLTVVR